MTSLEKRPNNDLRPDCQAFDQIVITTVPRYKTSHLSGDEWRISAHVKFYRKNKVVHETNFGNVEVACRYLGVEFDKAISDGKAFFAGDGKTCDQEGCSEPSTVTYKKKFDYCNKGHKHEI